MAFRSALRPQRLYDCGFTLGFFLGLQRTSGMRWNS